MNLLSKSLIVFFFLVSFFSFAQAEEIYVDENMNRINKEQFLNNCSKSIYRCSGYISDSLIINKIYSRFKFGKISPEVYKKLLPELYKKSEQNTDRTIVLRFVDRSLGSYKSYVKNEINEDAFRKKEGFIIQNGKKKHFKRKLYIIPELGYNINNEKYLYRENKCVKKINKKTNSDVFHLVKFDADSLKNISKQLTFVNKNNYLKDIRKSFSDSTRYVVIQPKGEFFSSEIFVHPDDIIDLINKKEWTEYKRDLKYSNSIKYKKGYGFFKPLPYRYRNFYRDYDLTCF